jgi:hypothetical protein
MNASQLGSLIPLTTSLVSILSSHIVGSLLLIWLLLALGKLINGSK